MPDQELDGQDDQGQDKKEQGDPVDAVHVLDKTGLRPVGIRFSEV